MTLALLLVFIRSRYRALAPTQQSFFDEQVPLDLWIYLRGGERVLDGVPLYEGALYHDLPFTYPPFSGVLFSWLAHLEDPTVFTLWQAMSIIGVMYVVWASLRCLNVRITPLYLILIPLVTAVMLFGAEPLHGTLYYGQVNILLMVLVCLDFLPGRYRLPGIGVGLAAGIKLTPAFFGILFLIQRRWWSAVGCFATFLVTVGIGFLGVTDAKTFWTDAMFNSDRIGVHDNAGAQSLKSVLIRIGGIESGAVWLVAALATVALVAWAAWLAVQRTEVPAAIGITGIGACLVSPFSWYHHWVWIVPVAVWVLVAANQAASSFTHGNAVRWQVAGLLSAAAFVLVLVPFCAYNVAGYGSHIVVPHDSVQYLVGGYLIIAGYILYALLERSGRASRAEDGARDVSVASVGA